VHLVRR